MSSLARAFRRASVPLAAYYAVTLALPVANGAARSGMVFVKHAMVVLLVPLVAVALGGAIHTLCARLRARTETFSFQIANDNQEATDLPNDSRAGLDPS